MQNEHHPVFEHDALDRIGGGQGRLRFSKGLQAGIFRFLPQLAVNWLSGDQICEQHIHNID